MAFSITVTGRYHGGNQSLLLMSPFLIIETGRPLPSVKRFGSFAHWIRVAAGLAANQYQVCRVLDDEPLPAAEHFAGALITGSGAMVTERAPWSVRTADWLRNAANTGLPLFGICYGHQLVADAFGGTVDYNPKGREMGTVKVTRRPDANDDPLFAGGPQQFVAQTTHLQTVLKPPPQASVLAHSALDDCQAFRVGDRVWGVQFHPEFSTTHMRGYIFARRQALAAEGSCHRKLLKGVSASAQARQVLPRFVAHARKLRR